MSSGRFTVLWVILGIIALCFGVLALIYGPRIYREGKAVLGPISDLTASEEAIEQLNAEYPFQVPEDGLIDEERFVAFLDARQELRDHYTGWEQEVNRIENEQPESWQGAKQALAVTRDLFEAQVNVLRKRSMSATEFVWLEDMAYRTWLEEVRRILGSEVHPEAVARVEEMTRSDLGFVEELTARHGTSQALDAIEDRLNERLEELAKRERPAVEGVSAANQELFWKYHRRIENNALDTVGGGIHNRFREPAEVRIDVGSGRDQELPEPAEESTVEP